MIRTTRQGSQADSQHKLTRFRSVVDMVVEGGSGQGGRVKLVRGQIHNAYVAKPEDSLLVHPAKRIQHRSVVHTIVPPDTFSICPLLSI